MPTPHLYDTNGQLRKLGNIAPPTGLLRAWRIFGDVAETPMIARSAWDQYLRPDLAADPFLPPVHNQGEIGQCNADATTAAMEAARAEQGLPYVQLSAADLYGQICGGADNGSTLEDGLHAAMAVGVATAASSGTLWRPGLPPGPAAERARYRVLQAFLCPTFDHCFSAVVAGFKLISGVPWFNNYTPVADGWLPSPAGSPAGGHAIMGFAPVRRGGAYGIAHQNSWTAEWGVGGRFVLPEASYAQGSVGGWWAVRLVVDTGGGVPAPVASSPR